MERSEIDDTQLKQGSKLCESIILLADESDAMPSQIFHLHIIYLKDYILVAQT